MDGQGGPGGEVDQLLENIRVLADRAVDCEKKGSLGVASYYYLQVHVSYSVKASKLSYYPFLADRAAAAPGGGGRGAAGRAGGARRPVRCPRSAAGE